MQTAFAPAAIDSNAITGHLRFAMETSEAATLAIGGLLDRIVRIATTATSDESTGGGEDGRLGVAERIALVTEMAGAFAAETRAFLNRQLEFARAANKACRRINACADSVAALMSKSHVLSINMRIESSRLKTPNTAFNVIGQEMSQFTVEVRKANEAIVEALRQLSDSLPQLESEAGTMERKAAGFADQFNSQIEQVELQSLALRESQALAARQAAEKNNRIVELSQLTLSELQFQDPMAQRLRSVAAALMEQGDEPDNRESPTPVMPSLFDCRAAGELVHFLKQHPGGPP